MRTNYYGDYANMALAVYSQWATDRVDHDRPFVDDVLVEGPESVIIDLGPRLTGYAWRAHPK